VPRIHFQSFFLGSIITIALALVAHRTLTVVVAQGAPALSTSVCQDLDINNDDQVNVVDFSQMANYFFKSCSQLASAGSSPSPKPPSPTPSAKPPSPTPSPVPTSTPGVPTAADPSGEVIWQAGNKFIKRTLLKTCPWVAPTQMNVPIRS
jgi:hypothetical protein